MKKSLLTLLCGVAMPFMALAAEMPEYCAGTSPNNGDGTHYAPNTYTVMVNGEEKVNITGSELVSGSTGISDLTATKSVELRAGDEITFNLIGTRHLQWGVAHLYIDWNANGDFTDDGEQYTIYENTVAGDLADYITSTSGEGVFNFTSSTPITVPTGIANGPVAMRIISGEARMHNSLSYDPCTTTKRGKMVTITAQLNGTADFAVPSYTDYEHLTALTFTTTDGELEAGTTVTLPFGTEITVNATAAEGYEIATITVLDEPIANGGTFALSASLTKDDIDIVVGQGKHALTVVNEADINYSITTTADENVDLSQVLEGTDLKLIVAVPDTKVLTAVMLNSTELHGTNNVYTFTMPAEASTLEIQGRDKRILTITIEQPAEGGTLVVDGIKKTDTGYTTGTLVSGDQTIEGEELYLSFERAPGYTFVNYLVNGEAFSGRSITVTEDLTIGAVTEEGVEYPAMTRYYTNGLNQQNRYLKKVTTSGTDTPVVFEATTEEELPFIYHQGPKDYRQEEGTVIDKTSNPIVVDEGTENFTFSFEPWSNAISVTISGTGYTCNTEIDWTQLAYYVDWNRDGDFTDQGEYVTRDTENMTSGKFTGKTTTKTVTIPEGTKPGIYRMRLVFNEPASASNDWTLNIWDNPELRNGVAYDFSISVVPAEFDHERTVTIVSEDENLGSVAFDDYEGSSISTKNKNVAMTATPAEGAEMLNWTNENNEIVSTNNTYIYKGETDATFTAHFGFRLTFTSDGNGTITATKGTETVQSGDVLAANAEVHFVATPHEDMTLHSVTVNGKKVEVSENGEFTVTVTEATEVKAVFIDAQYVISFNYTGNGSIVAGLNYTDNGMPVNEYADGDLIGKDSELYIAAVPQEGEKVIRFIINNGGVVTNVDVDTTNSFDDGLDDWRLEDGTICSYLLVDGDVDVTVEFSNLLGSIEGVESDSANGPVEYYNLQGMKVEAKHLTPGMYIVRQGGKSTKQLINKK